MSSSNKSNIFQGAGIVTRYVKIAYDLYMTREWISIEDILRKDNKGILDRSVTKYGSEYRELRKAVCYLRSLINEKEGKNCFEIKGSTRDRSARYVGKNNDPLSDLRNAVIIHDLKKYWAFCQDSAGFFPISWLEHFFAGSMDLLDMRKKKQKGELFISASLDRELANIEMLPLLYEFIKDRKVIKFDYKPFEENLQTFIFHPQYLKEFNGRWQVYGHAEGREPYISTVAIDRIQSKPEIVSDIEYVPSNPSFYTDFFKDIVGVSHRCRQMEIDTDKIYDLHIRIYNKYMFGLIETKKIHNSQVIYRIYNQYDDGEYGEIKLSVKINDELIGRILQMGDQLEVVSPVNIRKRFAEIVNSMGNRYQK